MLSSGRDRVRQIFKSPKLRLPALDLTRLGLPIITYRQGGGAFLALYSSPIPAELPATGRFWEKGIIVLSCEHIGWAHWTPMASYKPRITLTTLIKLKGHQKLNGSHTKKHINMGKGFVGVTGCWQGWETRVIGMHFFMCVKTSKDKFKDLFWLFLNYVH